MTSTWEQASVLVNGLNLHYSRTGSNKATVLLAHGLSDNGLCWTRLVQALEADFDFIMLDARGHGLSDHAASYLAEDHMADMIAFMDTLELNQVTLLGHSMGAVNAAYLAANHTERVSALLLEDPPWPAKPQSVAIDQNTYQNQFALQRTQDLDDLISAGKQDNPEWHELEFLAWAEAKRQLDPKVASWINEGKSFTNWREIVTKISCPTLLITGDTDVRVSPEVAQEAKGLCSSLSVAHIENAGHSIRRDQFDAYTKAVKSFLEVNL